MSDQSNTPTQAEQDWLTEQEDWIKTLHWDLYDVTNDLVTTLDQLESVIAPMSLEDFMKLPAARPMPDDLRREVEAKLSPSGGSTRS